MTTILLTGASRGIGAAAREALEARGCRVIGIAGGQAKCDLLVRELGFDAAVDYKAGNLRADLKAAAPDGIDQRIQDFTMKIRTLLLALSSTLLLAACANPPMSGAGAAPARNDAASTRR